MSESIKFAQLEHFGFGPNVMKKTKICYECGQISDSALSKCPACGRPLSSETLYDHYRQMHICCPVCETVLTDGSRYCPRCGTKIIRQEKCLASGSG